MKKFNLESKTIIDFLSILCSLVHKVGSISVSVVVLVVISEFLYGWLLSWQLILLANGIGTTFLTLDTLEPFPFSNAKASEKSLKSAISMNYVKRMIRKKMHFKGRFHYLNDYWTSKNTENAVEFMRLMHKNTKRTFLANSGSSRNGQSQGHPLRAKKAMTKGNEMVELVFLGYCDQMDLPRSQGVVSMVLWFY